MQRFAPLLSAFSILYSSVDIWNIRMTEELARIGIKLQNDLFTHFEEAIINNLRFRVLRATKIQV